MLKKISIIIISLIIIAIVLCAFDETHWNGIDNEDEFILHKFFNRLYFTVTTFSTTGYGDVTPKTRSLRMFVMVLQMVIFFQLLV